MCKRRSEINRKHATKSGCAEALTHSHTQKQRQTDRLGTFGFTRREAQRFAAAAYSQNAILLCAAGSSVLLERGSPRPTTVSDGAEREDGTCAVVPGQCKCQIVQGETRIGIGRVRIERQRTQSSRPENKRERKESIDGIVRVCVFS